MLLYNPIRFSLAKRIRVIYVKFRRERKKCKNFNAFLYLFRSQNLNFTPETLHRSVSAADSEPIPATVAEGSAAAAL